ncbi:FHA domain-containing protein, partial [Streptomyces palmae]
MRIRLTVLGPRSAHPGPTGRSGHAGRPHLQHAQEAHTTQPGHAPYATAHPSAVCAVDVQVTAPAGTLLATIVGGLADAVAAAGGEAGGGSATLFAGAERLDPQHQVLGEPPLLDGSVLSFHAPADPDAYPGDPSDAAAGLRLHIVAGPDAGGVHLLHGGPVRIGRSMDADVPLDDPDVSRLHCAVTVADDGRITVADLGSTNGTTLDGERVGARAVPLAPDAMLRIGESVLRLRAPAVRPGTLPTSTDGEGHVRVEVPGNGSAGAAGSVPASGVEPRG